MKATMHNNKKIDSINNNADNQFKNDNSEEDFELINRLSSIITLHSKGLTQSEIAEKLKVNQSTISRSLLIIKITARDNIEKYTKEEIPFEYLRYISGIDKITSTLWNLIENENTDPNIKFKIQGLSLLKQCYENRIEMLIGGINSNMNAKKHLQNMLTNERAELFDPMRRSF